MPNAEARKRAQNYGFFGRPTIPWSLECEAQGKSRVDVYNTLSISSEPNDEWQTNFFFGVTLVACFTGFFCIAGGVVNLLPSALWPVAVIVALLQVACQAVWVIVMLSAWGAAQLALKTSEEKITALSIVNGCVDDLTYVDQITLMGRIESSESEFEVISGLTIAIVVTIVLTIIAVAANVFLKSRDG